MVCKNCGSQLFEGDKFCSRCGTRVTEDALPAETVTSGSAAPMQSEMAETEASAAGDEVTDEVRPEAVEMEEISSGVRDDGALPPSIPEEGPSNSKSRFRGMFRGGNAASAPGKPKKRVSRVILGILCVVIVILMVNSAKLINSCHRNFSTPEEYYRWVERKAIQKNAKILAEYYVNHFVECLHRYDHHTSGEFRVELGDAGRDMLEQAGLEPWFEEGAFTFESTVRNSVTQDILGLEIGGEKLFSVDAIMDLRDEAVYLGFPGLTGTYLGVDTGGKGFAETFEDIVGMEPREYLDSLELLEILYEECPNKSQVEDLANRYLELLLNSIDDVRMRAGKTARVGSITQNCATLEIYLDKDDIRDMLTVFLEELREDSEIEELLCRIFDLAGELDPDMGEFRNFDEFYEVFQDNIDEILDNLDYNVTYHGDLDMTVYVDDKGQIIGRIIEFPNSRDGISFSYLNPQRGSRFGYKGSITTNDGEMLITGSGRNFGNKVNGSFTVKYEGSGIIDIEVEDFDMNSLKKGYINGSFTVSASSGIGRTSGMGSAYSYLSDMQLIIDVSMSGSSKKLNMELREGKELWGIITVSAKSGNGKKISVPSTRSTIFVDNDRDFEDWWDTIKWDDLIKKMDKAGLSSDAIDTVEEFSEMKAGEILDELSALMWPLMDGYLWNN